jgi:cytoskeletal protein CcmA (bactofilin family)
VLLVNAFAITTVFSGNKMKIEGEAKYIDSKGKRHHIEGVGNFPTEMLEFLIVNGMLIFDEITCNKIKIFGDCDGEKITAQNIFVEGTLKIESAKITESFEVEGKVKLHSLEAKEISAESCEGKIGKVKCDTIIIFHYPNEYQKINSRFKIKNINAQKVYLENCEVEEINCKNAVIGSNCVIEKLIVSAECEISADAKVHEIIRN